MKIRLTDTSNGGYGRWFNPFIAVMGSCIILLFLCAGTLLNLMPASKITPLLSIPCIIGVLIWGGITHRQQKQQLVDMAAEKEKLHHRMQHDNLTGLLNREAFNRSLDDLTSTGDAGHTIITLFFDLDRFKDVNDTLGHKVGDLLLIEVARRVEKLLPHGTAFARLGGDEFAALFMLEDDKTPEVYGQRIVTAIGQPFPIEGKIVSVGTSVGIAVGDPAVDDGHELLRRADVAMYEVKGTTRGGCRVFDDLLDGRQVRDSLIRVELGKSLIGEDLSLHYQPLVSARTGMLSSVEALLRAKSRPLSDIPPGTIVQIAENSGQITPLTEWTLDTAMTAITRLGDVPVAVNISPVYFRNPEFIHRIFDKLLSAQVKPDLLTIEVTEGVLISEMDVARKAIARLREIGVNVFLDDFGTGYSSLSYLQYFELDALKLDRSFLRDVGDKRRATQIIRSIIDFGHSLGMKVVMEGVESDWQVRLLQLLGCDLLQGYQIGTPMMLEDIEAFRVHNGLTAEIRNGSETTMGEVTEGNFPHRIGAV
ncbi:MAG: EAL domain-containing protein [Sphingobium sp.]|nr:EAL domain-containing protein [Sphingobium sp.]